MKSRINDGFLILDKPLGLSSRQLVDRIKPYTSHKIGHTGTLDPMATGMMVLAIGEATRFSGHILSQDKAYEATVQLGSQTDTDDIEGKIIAHSEKTPTLSEIETILKSFEGTIDQIPPNYSALHIDGKRAYKLARRDIPLELKPRPVTIHQIEIQDYNPKTRSLTLYIHCQSGTYIRSIARDLGALLGCYGHLSKLRRVWISPFEKEPMWSLKDLPKPAITLDAFFKDQAYPVSYQDALDLANGRMITLHEKGILIAYYQDTFLGLIGPKDNRYKAMKLRSNILEKLRS